MQTFTIKQSEINPGWHLIDATGKTLGRLATKVARLIRGKHKPEFTPHMDMGDFVIVINVEKVRVTGNKAKNKAYYHHSGYPGGIKSITFEKLLDKDPRQIIKHAVKGMLPKGPLGRKMLTKLKLYSGAEHPHAAQQPQILE